MTLVTVPAPEYARLIDDSEPVHGLLTTSELTSEVSCCKVGEVTVTAEPEASVTEKLLEFTVID
jgi:hypothetical protein